MENKTRIGVRLSEADVSWVRAYGQGKVAHGLRRAISLARNIEHLLIEGMAGMALHAAVKMAKTMGGESEEEE